MTAHVIRIDITETAAGLTVRYPDIPEEPRVIDADAFDAIEERMHELSEAEGIWESGAGRLRALRLELGAPLFALLDGPGRRLVRALEDARAADLPPHLVLRFRANSSANPSGDASSPRALRWRWETLHPPEGPLFGDRAIRAPRLTLQLGAADLGDATPLATRCLRVLFMASSPLATEPVLDFENEEERLLAAVAPFVDDGRVRFDVVEDGTLEALQERLQKDAYDIVVLSSHGLRTDAGPRLVLEDAEGARKDATPEELIEALGAAAHKPALVVLSSCHSADSHGPSESPSMVAALVAGGIDAALGWQRPVLDTVATELSHNLIAHLAQGRVALPDAVAYARSRLVAAGGPHDPSRHAWATMQLVSRSAAGFRLDPKAPAARPPVDRKALYRWLGTDGQMQVLQQGFVGRRRELQRLLRILRTGEDAGKPVAGALLWGNKGQGKSCLAARALDRHIHAFGDGPDGVGMIVLHGVLDAVRVLAAFQHLAETWDDDDALARLQSNDDTAFVRLRRLLRGHWKRRRVVIILDDFEQNLTLDASGDAQLSGDAAALLEALVPACRSGRPKLLLTCTSSFALDARPGALAVLELGPLEPSAVQKLWFRGREAELSEISRDEWKTLAERLGRNARVLAWARTLLSGKTPDEFLSIVEEAEDELPVFGDLVSEEERSRLAEMFLRTLAFRQLGGRSADVDTFLKRARVYTMLVPAAALAGICDDLDVDLPQSLDGLANLGLLEVGRVAGERVWRVSPLVESEFKAEEPARWHEVAAEFWEERVADEGIDAVQRAWEHALAAGRENIADAMCPLLDRWLWSRGLYQENWGHAQRHVAAFSEGFRGLWWAGECARFIGKLSAARRYMEKAESGMPAAPIDEQTEGAFLHAFAGVLQAQGDLNGARARLERSLEIKLAAYETDEHPDVAATIHELGRVLEAQGDLQGARGRLERNLAISQTIHETNKNSNVATALHSLAGVLLAQGNLHGARDLLQRSLAIKQAIHGSDEHPNVAASLHELGRVLRAQGLLNEARNALERSLSINRAIYGTDKHPNVASSLHVLAGVLRRQGDLNGARTLHDRSLAALLAIHGTEKHPDVAAALHDLSRVLQGQGDLSGAHGLLEQSLAIMRAIHGTEKHPEVIACLHSLASVLKEQGDFNSARALLGRSHEIEQAIYGTDKHPSVATGLDNLASLEASEGNLAEAIATLERCLHIRKHCFGTTDHHMYAESEVSLAMLLFREGRKDEAAQRLGHALSVLRTQVPNHPILKHFQDGGAGPSLDEAVSKWLDTGASAKDFGELLNLACNLVVRAAQGGDAETRQRILGELDALAVDPEPLPGTTGLVRGLQHLLRGGTLEDLPEEVKVALLPNSASALAKIEAMIREP